MSLVTGSRIGPYEIVGPLGAGGMGEVYRARDTKLGRNVAIKILPDALAADPERRGRFEREAKTLAALNHPHIAQIYGFEESPSAASGRAAGALVMELVEGPTLAERLTHSGPLRTDEAVAIARQLADALEAAHEQGIVHRDLKPANIKVRDDGTVKVLDFGLAKLIASAGPGGDGAPSTLSMSPTFTAATVAGVILGTAAYMAPEQARGKPADRRADIWAFGAVLYEMLTGRRAFPGDEISDTLASLLKEDPDWRLLPADLPSSLRRLLRRCLTKDPRQRLSAIGDARLDLDEREQPSIERAIVRSPARPLPFVGAMVASLLAASATTWLVATWQHDPTIATTTRFAIPPADNTTVFDDSTSATISPDGRSVAWVTGSRTESALVFTGLWVRTVDSLDVRPIAGTGGAFLPFWSPDSRQLAFFTIDHKLKKVTLANGHVEEICEAPDGRGGSWSRADVIVFSPANSGPLMRVAASGGSPAAVTTLDAARGETGHRFPSFLPDGDHFLYAVVPARDGNFDIFVGSLSGGAPQPLLAAQSTPVYADPGYVLFVRRGGLAAQRFEPAKRTLSGEPVSMADVPGDVGGQFMAGPAVSASTSGTLAYLPELSQPPSLLWLRQSGEQAAKINVPAGRYVSVVVTRDGRRAVLLRAVSPTVSDLWTVDLDRGSASRLTDASRRINTAIWSPDGKRVVFSAQRSGPRDLFVKAVGTPGDDPIYRSDIFAKDPMALSADGELLVFNDLRPQTNWDIWALPIGSSSTPRLLVQTPFNDSGAAISPDGRWLTYVSDESARVELYVVSFPTPGRKYQVTTTGASRAWWRGDSKQLLWMTPDRTQLLVADVQPGSEFSTTALRSVGRLPKGVVSIDATADLQRLLALVNEGGESKRAVTVVQNWTAALEKR